MTVEEIIEKVSKIIRRNFGEDVKIYLFGSWAKGDAQPTSDIDIAVKTSRKNKNKWSHIRSEIDELRTLRKIDIIDLSLTTKKFKGHIFKYSIAL